MKICKWSDGSNEDIAEMLKAHYNGEIDIWNFWELGSVRTIMLNGQPVDFRIVAFDHDELDEPIGNRTRVAVTVKGETPLEGWTKEDLYMALPDFGGID
jgi:hypothetical protein